MSLALLWLALALAAPGDGPGSLEERHQRCQAALEAQDEPALFACVEEWVVNDPAKGWTDFYGFHLALMRGDATAASAARTRAASKGGIPEETLRTIMAMELPDNPWVVWSQRALGVVAALIALAVISLRVRSVRLAAQGRYQG